MVEKLLSHKILKNQVVRFVLSAGAGFLVDISAYYLFYHNLLTQKTYHVFNTESAAHTVEPVTDYFARSLLHGFVAIFRVTKIS